MFPLLSKFLKSQVFQVQEIKKISFLNVKSFFDF